jgi:hypothetical protein
MPASDRKLHVFLCHASQDKAVVRDLYQKLAAEPWIDPWLDEEDLLPGQDWNMEIEKAVEVADVVIVCISSYSVSKEGYVQRELKYALDIALEKPEGTVFLIPLRLDDCQLPRRLRTWHYLDYFPEARQDRAFERLLQSLQLRAREREELEQIEEIALSEGHHPTPTIESSTEQENAESNNAVADTHSPDQEEKVEVIRQFPPYDRERFTIHALPEATTLHWVLNPGLAFNELVLGQRVPKVTLIDETIDKPLMERFFVPCPHCGVLHDRRSWGQQKKFGNWFGFVCPSCGKVIPSLWNLTSLLILFLLSPLWLFIYESRKKAWLVRERERLGVRVRASDREEEPVSWTRIGMGFGGMMFWFFVLLEFFTTGIGWDSIIVVLGISLASGFGFAWAMKKFMDQKPKRLRK